MNMYHQPLSMTALYVMFGLGLLIKQASEPECANLEVCHPAEQACDLTPTVLLLSPKYCLHACLKLAAVLICIDSMAEAHISADG